MYFLELTFWSLSVLLIWAVRQVCIWRGQHLRRLRQYARRATWSWHFLLQRDYQTQIILCSTSVPAICCRPWKDCSLRQAVSFYWLWRPLGLTISTQQVLWSRCEQITLGCICLPSAVRTSGKKCGLMALLAANSDLSFCTQLTHDHLDLKPDDLDSSHL